MPTSPYVAEPTRLTTRPHLIFLSELAPSALGEWLARAPYLADFAQAKCALALAIRTFDRETAAVIRALNQQQIGVVAWLLLPQASEAWLNLRNYPQAIDHYHQFHRWVCAEGLTIAAIGLDIEPPAAPIGGRGVDLARDLLGRVVSAHSNSLYLAARTAYTELVAEMHYDGYEVHAYQIPLIADDRRSGSTVLQRAFDIVEIAVDVEILMCYSSFPFRRLHNDLGGALVASYGGLADALGVGSTGALQAEAGLPPLSWEALERDLLIAAHYTDVIYLHSLEGCIERGLLPQILALDWSQERVPQRLRYAVITALRSLIFGYLVAVRFAGRLFGWLGWAVAAYLFWRERRRRRQKGLV